VNDGGDVADADVEMAVRQLLTRDEARVISVASLVIMAIGFVFCVMWLVVVWRTQRDLSGGGRFAVDSTGDDPDIGDRIVSLEQDGVVLMFSLLVLTAGSGLRLLSGRLLSQRQQINHLDEDESDVHEVTLQSELDQ
jgi:hypothetical protein